jgi:two-component system, chemotaxis family, chemotaxis protein CheY
LILQIRAEAMQTDQDAQLKLPAVLDLSTAEGFLATLRQRLQDPSPLRLDASAVETLTLPCIQILLSAVRDYEQISIERPSVEFAKAFKDLSLDWGGADAPMGEGFGALDGDPIEMQAGPIEMQADPAPMHAEPVQTEDDASDCNHEEQKDQRDMAKRILTIDDSKTIRDMLMLTLSDAGFDVLQAVDGQDGLDVLGDDRVDVIITDINMPRMDGYEVIRQLRQNSVHKTTPILVLTTESDAEKRNLARAAGATGWMVKPFDPDSLIATVRKVAP